MHRNLKKFSEEHKEEVLDVYWILRDQLVKILDRYKILQKVPHDIDEPIKIDVNIVFTSEVAEQLEILTEEASNSKDANTKMTQTAAEFLSLASRLVPDFDGKPENLRSFLDSLQLLKSLTGAHGDVAVSLIKTKLKGTARNLIGTESSIDEIVTKLTASVKGESVEVLSAKLMNIRQNSKTANTYCSELEALAKSLENAYISDGLPGDLASKYSTQTAVKAMTKNCSIDKVKLIMEAGQFGNMNDAISKFVNSCTEATGQQNAILYFGQKFNRNNNYRQNHGHNYRQNRGRYNYPRNNSNNNNNGRPEQRPVHNRNQQSQNYRRTRNYVRAAESHENDSENC